jgi:hypothetical protein
MFVLARRRASRCAYCHGGLGNGLVCTSCGAVLHAECRAELEHCPTFGCRSTSFTSEGEVVQLGGGLTPSAAAVRLFLRNTLIDAVGVTLVWTIGLFLFFGLMAIGVGTDHYSKSHEFVRGNPVAASALLLIGLAIAVVVGIIQRSHVRAVRRLVEGQAPRDARVELQWRIEQVKNGAITVWDALIFEGNRRTLTLGLRQNRGWLVEGPGTTRIGVYGGRGLLEPAVITDGERLRAVRSWRVTRH